MAALLGLIVAAVDVDIERLSDALSNVDVVCLKKVSKISHGVSSRTALIPTANGSELVARDGTLGSLAPRTSFSHQGTTALTWLE
jgi:hypothetical protein